MASHTQLHTEVLSLLLGKCLAASWQRRFQRWFSNVRIDVSAIYGPLMIWAMQQSQKPDKVLHLALDTTLADRQKIKKSCERMSLTPLGRAGSDG